MTEDRWLSTQEAADRIGITSRTLYRRINEGDLPAYKIGRLIKLKCSEVDTYIDAQRIKPGELSHLYPDMSDLDAIETSDTDTRGR